MKKQIYLFFTLMFYISHVHGQDSQHTQEPLTIQAPETKKESQTQSPSSETLVSSKPIDAVDFSDLMQPPPTSRLTFTGYGDMRFSYFRYGPDQTQVGGSSSTDRVEFDLTRFVFEIMGSLPGDVSFEAEIEFEHGGTGSELELEYEEFGEFNREVSKGGEVIVEELFLQKMFNDHWRARIGMMYVQFGWMSDELLNMRLPTEMIGASRPEAELSIIPAVWNEMGISVEARYPKIRALFQVINGLDSTGFSSHNWIASGHQKRFETIAANDLAFNTRVDFTGITQGLVLGSSFYWAPNTIGNRPKPDIRNKRASLYLADVHVKFDWKNLRSRGNVIWGHLENAQVISEKNRLLSNNLGVSRSPVSDQAFATWAEVGWDIGSYINLPEGHRLEPYVRFQYYDTMFKPRKELFDNPRFERTIYTAGLGYTIKNLISVKVDWNQRSMGSSAFRKENFAQLNVGFIY